MQLPGRREHVGAQRNLQVYYGNAASDSYEVYPKRFNEFSFLRQSSSTLT